MTLPKYKNLSTINEYTEIEKEILLLTKELFNLRLKKATRQNIKSHLFVHSKRRLAQLNFKKNLLLKTLK